MPTGNFLFRLCAVGSLFLPLLGQAAEPLAHAVCAKNEEPRYYDSEKPSPQDAKALASCESRRFYYGIGIPKDYRKARHCAFLELDRRDGHLFSGEVILMSIYANGLSVKKDFELAVRLACRNGHAPAEIQGRVEHLLELKKAEAKGPPKNKKITKKQQPFDFCDDTTSGYMMGVCAGLEQEISEAGRSSKLIKLVDSWPPAHRQAFSRLLDAKLAFVQARGRNEVDLSGTGRSAFVVEEEEKLNHAFQKSLFQFEKNGPPKYSAEEFRKMDEELNALYARLRKQIKAPHGTVTFEGVQAVQRKWLEFRDAWAAFGPVHFPKSHADAWSAWATRERTAQLKKVFGTD